MKAIEKIGNELKINITDRQRDFIESTVDDVLYGGSAGGGKSYAILLFAVMRRSQVPNSRGVIFRRTFPELERSLIQKSREMYPLFGGKYNESKKSWTFPNGSVQEFGHVERQADVYNYLSAEYQDMCFDELTSFTEFQFTYLTSRLRSAIPGVKTYLRSATNPGGPGHRFVYERYVGPSKINKIWKDTVTGKTMTFIPAKIKDNPFLMEADPDYAERLKELKKVSEAKYLALAEGRWDVFEGAFFPEWNPNLHILRKVKKPESYTYKFISMDWGYAEPAAVLWFELTPLGRLFIYRELYTTKRSPKELARDILNMSPEGEEYMYIKAPPEIWGKKIELEGGGESIQSLMQTEFGDRIRMEKASNARVSGWTKMREYLSLAPDGYPWLQVSPSCGNFIRSLPQMIYEDRPGRNPEDMREDGDNHMSEACRYGLTGLKEVPRSPLSPYATDYEKIFGINEEKGSRLYSEIEIGGRSGYGL